jgi:hypothetical protein
MDPRFVATSKLLFEQGLNDEAAEGREYTTAELDAIADFSSPLERLRRVITAGMRALRPRRQGRQIASMPGMARPHPYPR